MMINLTESILSSRAVDPENIAQAFVRGAKVMALAVGLTIQGITKEDLPGSLLENVMEETYRKKLSAMTDLLAKDAKAKEAAHRLGNGVLSHESVPAALFAFIKLSNDYGRMIEFCLSLGGDTDTIAAMAGALSGAYISEDNLPKECLQRLEDAERIKDLSLQLFEFSNVLKSKHIHSNKGYLDLPCFI